MKGSRGAGLWRPQLAALLIALLSLLGWLAWHATPSTEAVRLRNAWLVDPSTPADFDWTPERLPPGFRTDRSPPDPRLIQAQADPASDWNTMRLLAGYLTEHRREDTDVVQADYWTAVQLIRQGWGNCADYIQAFLPLARAHGLFAREWAFSLDGYGGHGHAVVEVWDRQRRQWVFLDVYNNVHAVDRSSGDPLSVAQLRQRLKQAPDSLEFRKTGLGPLGYRHPHKLLAYYQRGQPQWYLWWSNAVQDYDAHPVVTAASRLGRSAEQLAALVAGIHPRFRIIEEPQNQTARDALARLRWQLGGWLIVTPLLGVGLVWQWRRRRLG